MSLMLPRFINSMSSTPASRPCQQQQQQQQSNIHYAEIEADWHIVIAPLKEDKEEPHSSLRRHLKCLAWREQRYLSFCCQMQ
jgi:hypothetical protein